MHSLLQIVREPLRPGCEAAYSAVEEELARISAALGCPHPYLGAESLTGPKEVWWFNGFESEAEQRHVYDAYQKNVALMSALQQGASAKKDLTLEPIDVVARYTPEASAGVPWVVGQGRYLVITRTTADQAEGTVFDGVDGTRFIVTATRTREEAEGARAAAGDGADVFIVRPSWSFPAPEWIEADPTFWQTSPAAKDSRSGR